MKKSFKSAFVLTACLGVSVVLGCSKEDKDVPPETCSESLGDVQKALTDKVVKADKQSCEAYKTALRKHIDNCSGEISKGLMRDYDRDLAEACPN